MRTIPPFPLLLRWFASFGQFFVLAGLCAVFSVFTLTEQEPSGKSAITQLVTESKRSLSPGSRILAVFPIEGGDAAFADLLKEELQTEGFVVVDIVIGQPRDVRRAIRDFVDRERNKSLAPFEAIVSDAHAGEWQVFDNLGLEMPSLTNVVRIKPRAYYWPTFLKPSNLLNIANQIAVIAIVAIGMTIVIITGGIDLSVGSLIALSAVACTLLIRECCGGVEAGAWAMLVCAALSIVICGLVGAFTGVMIVYIRTPPFIATLSMMLMASGVAYLLTRGESVYQVPEQFVWLGRDADMLKLPNSVLLMLLLYLMAHVVMSKTVLGRYLYAVGGNREAARLSGVPVNRVLLFAYVTCAMLAGLGGVIMASQLKSGAPAYGQMYELYVIAAVVVGGASLAGGEGNMLGTLIGAFTIAVIQNGMNLTNIESYTQKVVLGMVILMAVVIDTIRRGHGSART